MYRFSCMEMCKGLIECDTISLTDLEIFGFNTKESLLVLLAPFELNCHKQGDLHLF